MKMNFGGLKDESGNIVEHFGYKCQGAVEGAAGEIVPCGFRYRFRICEHCGAENDISATLCGKCRRPLIDNETKLQEALKLRDAHVMRPDSMTFEKKVDKKGTERLEIRYYDLNSQHLSEVYFFSSPSDPKVFYYNFVRMHNRLPERRLNIASIDEAIRHKECFRRPLFVIARKQNQYWRIREKIFL